MRRIALILGEYRSSRHRGLDPRSGRRLLRRFGIASSLLLLVTMACSAPGSAAPLDENITIAFTASPTSIKWSSAGNLVPRSSGTLGPFIRACAILQGTPSTSGDTMVRAIYVLDAGNEVSDNVTLHVYTRTDIINSSGGQLSDAVTITPKKALHLSALVSKAGVTCYMAANETSVFASTSANQEASIVNKESFAQSSISSLVTDYADAVSQITATSEGIVFVTFGKGPHAGFAEYDQASKYLAAGQWFNFTVLAETLNATTF